MSEATWLSEAVVEFLKGPMYINPLMSFIDEWCLIFTPEEENKLEYTTCHNMFKELVDKLLTDFLAELGVGPDEFFKVVSAAQETDQLTSFVVQTILTVDDFLMFKAMMVRRNIDLTSQVLNAVAQAFAEADAAEGGETGSITSKLGPEEEEALREAMELSNSLHTQWSETDKLQRAMRALQLEDEEVALPVAIALSLREHARFDSELADIEQAIALSLALDEERKRLASQQGERPAAAAGVAAPASPGGKAAAGAAAAAGVAAAASPGGKAAAGAAAMAAAVAAKPAAPGAAKPAAGEAAKAASLPAVKAPARVAGAPSPADAPAPAAPAAKASPDSAAARPSKFVPAPIDAPTGAPATGARSRAAGYRSEASGGVDLEAIRKAAQQAAESQKKLIGKGDANDEASKWLQEAKKKLVAQRQADRDQELEEYKASAKPVKGAAPAAAPSADEAKRAALREALAQKMKQSIMQKQ